MRRKKYTVFGLQRSGTNFLEQQLMTGLPNCRIINAYAHDGPWKHTYDIHHDIKTMYAKTTNGLETYDYWIARLRETNAIWIHKHPVMWVQSVLKKNVDCRRHPDFDGKPEARVKYYTGTKLSLCNMYRNHWLFWKEQSRHQKIYRVPYEHLLPGANAKMHTKMIAEFFNDDDFTPYDRAFDKVPMSAKFTEDDRNKYLKYETNLNEEDQAFILKHVGKDCLKYYGYDI